MSDSSRHIADLPLMQQSHRGDRVRPTIPFIEFKKEEVEQSIPDRFEQMVHLYPNRLAVKTKEHALTYDELNKAANRVARTILNTYGEKQNPVTLLFEHPVDTCRERTSPVSSTSDQKGSNCTSL